MDTESKWVYQNTKSNFTDIIKQAFKHVFNEDVEVSNPDFDDDGNLTISVNDVFEITKQGDLIVIYRIDVIPMTMYSPEDVDVVKIAKFNSGEAEVLSFLLQSYCKTKLGTLLEYLEYLENKSFQ